MNSWQIALKQYNSDGDKYIIPKKGSEAYNVVKKIREGLDGGISKKGKGLKEIFEKVISNARNAIKSTIPTSKDNTDVFPGEIHAINVKKEDGKLAYKNYQYAGPGTKVKQRLELEKTNPKYKPINNIDNAARSHDIDYTYAVNPAVRKGVDKTFIKAMVRGADDKFLARINAAKHEDPLLVSAINKVFYGKKLAEDTGFLDPASFATGEGVKQKKSKKSGKIQDRELQQI